MAQLMKAAVGGGGVKPLLKVSQELGVLTWGIYTPWSRNLGGVDSLTNHVHTLV